MLKFRHAVKIIPIMFYASSCSKVLAVEMDYSLEASLARYDNINRVPNPVEEEWARLLTAEITLNENTTNLLTNIEASITSYDYKNDQNQDESTKELAGSLLWIVNPQHFEWYVSDVFTQIKIDSLGNNVQSNRQNINVFVTGPNYYWRLNSRNNINLEARLAAVTYETNNDNNVRELAAARWVYLLNSATSASLNAEFENTDFKDPLLNDLFRTDIYGAVNYVRGRNTAEAEIGVTNVNFESKPSESARRYKLKFTNQRTRTSNIQFEISQDVSDTGRKLASSSLQSDVNTAFVSANSDVYKDEKLSLTYEKSLNSGNFELTYIDNSQTYSTQSTLNRNRDITFFRLSHNFSQISSISFEGLHAITDYTNSSPRREDVDDYLKASYIHTTSKNILFNLSVESFKKDSTDLSRIYEDKKILFSVKYFSK